jgi:ferredoxin
MSVEITFEVDDGHGLVAEGTSLWEAAKRLGVSLPADCKGCGECDTCTLVIVRGAELLSPANEFEMKILGPERLGVAQRLACQTKLDKTGEVVVRRAKIAATARKKAESGKAFRDLPLKQQVGAFIEVEATKISEAVNALRGQSNALVEKFLNLKPQKSDSTHHNDRGAPPTDS